MNKFEKVNSLLSVKKGDFIKLTKVQENSLGVVKVGKFHCGTLVYEPEIGCDVFLVGNGGGIRTSTIAGILKFTTFWVVKTRNSAYVLELITE